MRYVHASVLTVLFACADVPNQPMDDVDTDTDTGLPSDHSCAEPQQIMDEACVSCHGRHAVDGLDLRDITNALDLVNVASGMHLIDPGNPDSSYLLHKLNDTHLDIGGMGVPMPPAGPLEEEQIQILTEWIEDGATCDEPPEFEDAEYDPNTLDQHSLFTCDGTPSSSPARLRRINRVEFMHRTGHHRDHETQAAPFEAPAHLEYSSYSEDVSMDTDTLDLYFNVLVYAGDKWEGRHGGAWIPRYDESIFCIYSAGIPDAACVEEFVEVYLMQGVLHNLPGLDEVERLTQFALNVLADESGDDGARDDSIGLIASAAWLHTNALFDSEVGREEADELGRHRLTDWETASMMTDMLSNLGPGASGLRLGASYKVGEGDDAYIVTENELTAEEGGHFSDIVDAAMDGSIQNPEVAGNLLRTHAMGIDPDRKDESVEHSIQNGLYVRRDRSEQWMSDKLDRFFVEYFDIGDFLSGFQETPKATTKYDAEDGNFYQRALDTLREFRAWTEPDGVMLFTDAVAKVVVEDEDVLNRLLTTQDFYLPASSDKPEELNYEARIFGYEGRVEPTQAGRWVTFPEEQRKGILTHPVWLASHGDAFEDGPSAIHRGKWIREKLFCKTVPSLQLVTVDAQLIPSADHLSARDRIQESIETNQECMTCHQYMNDLGYPFEKFNHAGLIRETDHGQEPNSSTQLINAPDPSLNRSYNDVNEFIDAMAESEYVKRCFIRHTFRYFAGRDETLADACVLTEMEETYDTSGGSFVSVLETLATHDVMMYRTWEETP